MQTKSKNCPANAIRSLDLLLRRLACSATTQRVFLYASSLGASRSEAELLASISVAESSARPLDARGIEWIVAWVLRSGVVGSKLRERGQRVTVGPFQMANAPFRLREAVIEALTRVRARRLDIRFPENVAREWNGHLAESSGLVPYSVVLRRAAELINQTT